MLLIVAGYVVPSLRFPSTKEANAELTDELLATYIAKDTDADGLPDWQESLYGTNVNVADTDGDGITDGEAVRTGLLTPAALASQLPEESEGEEDVPGESPAPGSITEQFARSFFEAYMKANNGQPITQEAQQELVQRMLADFSSKAGEKLASSYTAISVRTSPSVSVLAYVQAVEDILRANDLLAEDSNALPFMQRIVEDSDAEAAGKLAAIASSYEAIERDLLALSVPPPLADEHLALIRSFDTLGRSARQFTKYEEDPLGVLGALTVFQPGARELRKAYEGLAAEILKTGEPLEGGPGYLIVFIARYMPSL